MSIIHMRQIQTALENRVVSHLDLSDIRTKVVEEFEKVKFTRALAAFSLVLLGDVLPDSAAASVTDGQGDNGIDAIYYDSAQRHLFLVQSKWHPNGTGTLSKGDALKFIKGIDDLLEDKLVNFNAKIQKLKPAIESALFDAATRFVVVVIHTGTGDLSPEVKQTCDDMVARYNDTSEVVVLKILKQSNLYGFIAKGMEGAPIDIEIALYEWGQVDEPFHAYYGQVAATDVATWWHEHYPQLFAPNIRVFLGDTHVNEGLISTIEAVPEHFWFFNNGITALCDSIKKKPIGGAGRQSGIFECKGFTIVNGAQTAGSLASAASQHANNLGKARVPLRVISLEGAHGNFAKEVTRNNNTQNRIERRDFVALDPEQERLRTELLLDNTMYVYKSGESVHDAQAGFDLVEATVARACIQDDVSFSVLAKSGIGRLWDDIEKHPYKVLFNPGVSGRALWRSVQLLRVVEEGLPSLGRGRQGRERLLSIHGNRFLTHVVAKCLMGRLQASNDLELGIELRAHAAIALQEAYKQSLVELESSFPGSYLASLFKNQTKCRQLAVTVIPLVCRSLQGS
ncbi:MAG: AIPR family protein [Nannocystaceae bacterium]